MMNSERTSFPLAPMSREIRTLTLLMLVLPVIFLAAGALGLAPLLLPGLFLVVLYLWIWTRFRPTAFVIHPGFIEVVWPLKRREIRRESITDVRILGKQEFCSELGPAMRIGAGGLWGGFGWLWTKKRGIVQFYVTRTDQFVWIERLNARPWLIKLN